MFGSGFRFANLAVTISDAFPSSMVRTHKASKIDRALIIYKGFLERQVVARLCR